MIKISCCLIGITLHVNENELTLIQRFTAVWWKLPAVRLQLPVWLFARNVLIKTPGGSGEMKARSFWKLPFVCNFTLKYRPVLYCGVKCPTASSTLCKCLCSSDAVDVQSAIFSPVCTLIGSTLCFSDLGIQKFSNFYVLAEFNSTFVKVGAIRRIVAVWYLQQGSVCTVKRLLCVTVIAHRGTLSRHYIKPFDGVTLSGPF